MKLQKKAGLRIVLTICILAGLCLAARPIRAEAAAYKRVAQYWEENERNKAGGYYLWNSKGRIYASKSKTGAGKAIAKASKGGQFLGALSDGSAVYYEESRSNSKYLYIYSVKINGKNRKLIGKVKEGAYINAYYNGNLYVPGGLASAGKHTYRLNVKTKKVKCIIKNAVPFEQYKQYMLFCDNQLGGKAYIYNCNTGKFIKFSNKCMCGLNFSAGKVYYAEKVNNTSVRIMSCSINGKNKRTLVKKLSADPYNVRKITSRYVYYIKYKGNNYKCYRYDMKMKSSKEISEKTYLKIVSG